MGELVVKIVIILAAPTAVTLLGMRASASKSWSRWALGVAGLALLSVGALVALSGSKEAREGLIPASLLSVSTLAALCVLRLEWIRQRKYASLILGPIAYLGTFAAGIVTCSVMGWMGP